MYVYINIFIVINFLLKVVKVYYSLSILEVSVEIVWSVRCLWGISLCERKNKVLFSS